MTAGVEELWQTIVTRAGRIWSAPDFHFLELTYAQFEELLPGMDIVISDFSEAAYRCASSQDLEAVKGLYRGFADWMALCDIPPNFCGKVHRGNYDLFKLVGQQMFTVLIASLIRYEHWDTLKTILSEDWGQRYQTPLRHSMVFSQYYLLPAERVSELLVRHCSLPDYQAAEGYLRANP